MARIIVTADTRGSDEQRILLDEGVCPAHMSDEHSASQLLERLGWAVTDAERAPAVAARRHRRQHPRDRQVVVAAPAIR
jgi:hypothetical protein